MVCFSVRLLHRSYTVRVARVDPIPFHIKNDATGLGKTSQDFRMIETTVSQRRELDSERQRNETEEQRRAREVSIADTYIIQLVTHYSYYSGKRCTSCRSADRDIRGSPTILLHGLRQAIPKCRPIRRAHQFIRPPPQDPIPRNAKYPARQAEYPGGAGQAQREGTKARRERVAQDRRRGWREDVQVDARRTDASPSPNTRRTQVHRFQESRMGEHPINVR